METSQLVPIETCFKNSLPYRNVFFLNVWDVAERLERVIANSNVSMIAAFSGIVEESERRQMKQCWVKYLLACRACLPRSPPESPPGLVAAPLPQFPFPPALLPYLLPSAQGPDYLHLEYLARQGVLLNTFPGFAGQSLYSGIEYTATKIPFMHFFSGNCATLVQFSHSWVCGGINRIE